MKSQGERNYAWAGVVVLCLLLGFVGACVALGLLLAYLKELAPALWARTKGRMAGAMRAWAERLEALPVAPGYDRSPALVLADALSLSFCEPAGGPEAESVAMKMAPAGAPLAHEDPWDSPAALRGRVWARAEILKLAAPTLDCPEWVRAMGPDDCRSWLLARDGQKAATLPPSRRKVKAEAPVILPLGAARKGKGTKRAAARSGKAPR
jgi:hypothetical protein